MKFLNKLKFWLKLLILSPGVVVHEVAHAFFCIITRTKIFRFVPFRFSEVAGYVEHERAKNLISAFLISFGPLFLNTYLAFIFFKKFDFNYKNINSLVVLYMAVTISMSAIPSDADGNSFGRYIKSTVSQNFLLFPLFIFYIFVWILNLLNYLKKYKIDYFFTALLFYLAVYYFK